MTRLIDTFVWRKGGAGFLQLNYLLGRKSPGEVWLRFWAMNGALSGRVWVVAVPGRQASGLLCLCGDARGPLGLAIHFSEKPAGLVFLLSHRTWCRELRWNLQGAGEGQSWSSACTQGARAVALAMSGKRGPHLPPGLAFPFLGSCISPPPTWAGRGWSKHPHLCLPQLELPARGCSQRPWGPLYPGLSLLPTRPPQA